MPNLESTIKKIMDKGKKLNEDTHVVPGQFNDLGDGPVKPGDTLPDVSKDIKPSQGHLPTPTPIPGVGTVNGDAKPFTPNKPISEEDKEKGEGENLKEEEADDDDTVDESADAKANAENARQYAKQATGEPQHHVNGQKADPEHDYDENSGFAEPFDASKEDNTTDLAEDVQALFAGQKLSKSFMKKAAAIYEAAINMRVKSLVEAKTAELEAQFETKLNEAVAELETKTEGYLDVVVENWMKHNEVAIERSLRTELAEEFLDGFKNLCLEHYIEIPESKIDVVAQLSEKIERMESSTNELMEQIVELKQENKGFKKAQQIAEATKGLSAASKVKVMGILENVDYTDEASFAESIKMVTEGFIATSDKKTSAKPQETLTEGVQPENAKPQTGIGAMLSQMKHKNLI